MLDNIKYQRIVDDLVEESQEISPKKIPIKEIRERVQRWLVSQRNDRWVMETIKTMIDGKRTLIK